MGRARLRDLGIIIGDLPSGTYNAITDVPGVSVGHCTLIHDAPRVARTGVTMIVPREEPVWRNNCFAGFHSFNGNGEMTGLAWLEESGMLVSAIGITNTHQVGIVRDALVADAVTQGYEGGFLLPVVAETFDGWLNDIDAFHLTQTHVADALARARSGTVEEGNVGGGTGMICHGFKGGIGTSSRMVSGMGGQHAVGVLVQANYGSRHLLRVDGVPVGREIPPTHTPLPRDEDPQSGSIIIVIATDAPLLPMQCKRLAQRATVGLARAGGVGHNGSGDLFLAFSTANQLAYHGQTAHDLQMIPHQHLNPYFDAVAEATEEAILNALMAADTMTGFKGRTVHALPLDELQRVMTKYRPSI
jgi:D-aminopeptidase